jgi:CRP-like cAMP-binding protein
MTNDHRVTEVASNPLIQRLEHAGPLSHVEREVLHELVLSSRYMSSRNDVEDSQASNSVSIVMSGVAYRYKIHPDGQRRIVHILLPGDIYDLHASAHLASDWHLGAPARCHIVNVQRRKIEDLAVRHSGIAQGLWWAILVELDIEREWLVNDSRPADRRLGHLFCELLVRLQMIGLASDNSYYLHLTQIDLADATAVSFVHMSRIMQSLRKNDLVNYERGHMKIPDFARLRDFSEFDPTFLHISSHA